MFVSLWTTGVCHSVPVSEIISVREEDEEDGSSSGRRRDDGSWKKIQESEGKGCRQAFTGEHTLFDRASLEAADSPATHSACR